MNLSRLTKWGRTSDRPSVRSCRGREKLRDGDHDLRRIMALPDRRHSPFHLPLSAQVRNIGTHQELYQCLRRELMVDNADKAISRVCRQTGAKVKEYTAAPLFMLDKAKGRHQWMIEFEKMPPSLDDFAPCWTRPCNSLIPTTRQNVIKKFPPTAGNPSCP